MCMQTQVQTIFEINLSVIKTYRLLMIMACQPTQQQAHNRTSAGFTTIQQM